MARQKKCYYGRRSRGGTSPNATDTKCPEGRNPKDYSQSEHAFHGGAAAYDRWAESGKKGYL